MKAIEMKEYLFNLLSKIENKNIYEGLVKSISHRSLKEQLSYTEYFIISSIHECDKTTTKLIANDKLLMSIALVICDTTSPSEKEQSIIKLLKPFYENKINEQKPGLIPPLSPLKRIQDKIVGL